MIKRIFYRADHKDDDTDSDSTSSSSDSDSHLEAQSPLDSESAEQQDEHQSQPRHLKSDASSSSSGYESEDSSAHEVDAESPVLPNDEDVGRRNNEQRLTDSLLCSKENGGIDEAGTKNYSAPNDVSSYILKRKSVFKCRICPKIVCLNEESLTTHLKSKRHVRSEKLLEDGRLKRMLNSDGEEVELIEEEGETHAERHARILALAQAQPKTKSKGRQRQKQRLKRKREKNISAAQKSESKAENITKRRRKSSE